MGEKINIELEENTLSKLEGIARVVTEQTGKAVSVEDLIGIAVDRHLDRLSKKLNINS